MGYIANTPGDIKEMLGVIGISSGGMEELFKSISPDDRPASFALSPGMSEFETEKYLRNLGKKNNAELTCFIGGGFYDHFIPAAIDAIVSRSEFYTAYTPYQPEASQGTLQAIYEYQSAICRLTGMDAANASLYDGGTALYEAAMMAVRATGRKRIIVDCGVNPLYRDMLRNYIVNLPVELVEVPADPGRNNRRRLLAGLDDTIAAVILQNPDFFGFIDDHTDISEKCHGAGALLIESVYPISLGLLKTPGEMGADITTGEGQSLGIPLSFGGPYLGFMAVKKKYVRNMPGRIVGATVDTEGRRGFVLTLQTREQHIRREKATSNICSNQALCALRALVYMSLIGKEGFRELAGICRDRSEYAKQRLRKIKGVEMIGDRPTFNEFPVRISRDPDEVIGELLARGIAAGFPLGRYYDNMKDSMIIAVTEKRTKEEIDSLAAALEDVLCT